jgi:Domain of unknown function (DUF4832)/Beta-galactosidase
LSNPDKGWFHHYYDDGNTRYLTSNDEEITQFPGMHHLYLRMPWSSLEPTEGNYNWKLIDDIVNKWWAKGYKIAIKVTCSETAIPFATPEWVKNLGVKGAYYPVRWDTTQSFWEPAYDDPIFLEKLENFYGVLSERYKNQPFLQYVDIGSYGNWGEGHTSFSIDKPISVEAMKKHVDLFYKHFSGMTVSIGDEYAKWNRTSDEEADLKKYIEDKGVTWRDDSILVDYWLKAFPEKFSVDRPNYYEDTYKNNPTVIEAEHYQLVKDNGNWIGLNGSEKGAAELKGAIGLMHATYVGFHGYAGTWLSENPDLAKSLGNYIGYWFFLKNINFSSLELNKSIDLEMVWANKGVAPAYVKYKTHLKFINKNDVAIVYDVDLSDSINPTKWLTGDTKQNASFTLPSSLPKGAYKLQVYLQRYINQYDVSNIDLGFKANVDQGGKVFEIAEIQIQ